MENHKDVLVKVIVGVHESFVGCKKQYKCQMSGNVPTDPLTYLTLLPNPLFGFCTTCDRPGTKKKEYFSGFVRHVTVLVQKLNNNSHNKCKIKFWKKTLSPKSDVRFVYYESIK
jgi:hypothetical protein